MHLYVRRQDGPHRALLSNSTVWMCGRPLAPGFFLLEQMLSSDPSYLRYVRRDGIAFPYGDVTAASKVTYEREHLGYVCNHGSLNRERDAAVQAVPYL